MTSRISSILTAFPGPMVAFAFVSILAAAPARAEVGDELFKFTTPDATAGHKFGWSVAISGNTAIVGAYEPVAARNELGSAYVFDVNTGEQLLELTPTDDSVHPRFGRSVALKGPTSIVGAPTNFIDGRHGSASVFDVTTGNRLLTLTAFEPADLNEGESFGHSVALSGNTVLIGAPGSDDAGFNSGAVYLFDIAMRADLFKLTASDAAAGDFFGYSVAISGNKALVGAVYDDEAGVNSGAAYVFDVVSGQQLFKLTASDAAANDNFGAVALSGNIALVGSPDGDNGGAAYLFDVNTGEQLAKLTPSDAAPGAAFGYSVAISGTTAIIGAPLDARAGPHAGAVYLFDVMTGRQLAKFTGSDTATSDNFGWSVARSGNRAVVGAIGDDDAGISSGAAYVFQVVPEPATPTSFGLFALTASCFCRRQFSRGAVQSRDSGPRPTSITNAKKRANSNYIGSRNVCAK